MIKNIQRPQCYNAFYSAKTLQDNTSYKKKDQASIGIQAATYSAGLACASLVTWALAKKQSKLLNKKVSVFNVHYNEFDMLKVAFAALAGGTITGIASDDKKHIKPKLQEALHQAIANIICPLLFVFLLNKGYSKISPNIKLPQFKENSSLKKGLNTAIKVLPNLLVAIGGLAAGVVTGTAVSNYINKKLDNNHQKRKIKLLDFCYHPDDIATALVLADKQGNIQRIAGRIIPPVFALHGMEAGSKRG